MSEADRRADDVLYVFGVLYSDRTTGQNSAETVIEALARADAATYHFDLASLGEHVQRALDAAGVVPSDPAAYAGPHMRAAYYFGLAIGWRVARQFRGGR